MLSTLEKSVSSVYPHGFLQHYHNAFEILSQNLDLSWKEVLTLSIAPELIGTYISHPQFMATHQTLCNLVDHLPRHWKCKLETLIPFCSDQNKPLETRFFYLLMNLSNTTTLLDYTKTLEQIAFQCTPDASALFNAVKDNVDILTNLRQLFLKAG
jgi:hypothetical protein